MSFGAPVFLLGLGALLVPIIIHLWSRHTQNQIPFGSIRFLTETVTKTTRQFFPSDLLLLLLRCLLFLLLTLLLAEPFFYEEKVRKTAYLIDPVLDKDLEKIKSFIPEGADIFWLSETQTPVTDSLQNYRRNLWQSYSAYEGYDSLVVFSPRKLSDFCGRRIDNAQKVNWIIPPADAVEKAVALIKKGGKNYHIIGRSNQSSTYFEVQETTLSGVPLSLTVYIYASDKHKELAGRISAALQAISSKGYITVRTTSAAERTIDSSAWVVWLKEEKPEWRKNLLYLEKDQKELIRQIADGIYAMPPAGTQEMLQGNFPLLLEKILQENLIAALQIDDLRILPEAQLRAAFAAEENGNGNSLLGKFGLEPIGWIIFIFLLLTERVLSNLKARQ